MKIEKESHFMFYCPSCDERKVAPHSIIASISADSLEWVIMKTLQERLNVEGLEKERRAPKIWAHQDYTEHWTLMEMSAF